MPTPRAGYHTKDGTRVPGVTTIIGRFKESGGLIHWAWDLGRQGKDYRAERDQAAEIGTLAHGLVERHIKGEAVVFDPAIENMDKVWTAYEAYLMWERQSKIEIIETEMPLVSEEYRYGGTPDAVGMIGNAVVLLDWKTSNSLHRDYLCQLAAYAQLLHEVRGLEVTGFHLCKFSRETGDFAHFYWESLPEAWEAFQLMRKLYELDKQLKRRAA